MTPPPSQAPAAAARPGPGPAGGPGTPQPTPAPGDLDDRFATARRIADAVIYEGYVLYPYRSSSGKNQVRWQFGVLVPPAYQATEPSERSTMRTECVVEAGSDARIDARVRFLRVQTRTVHRFEAHAFRRVSELAVGDTIWSEWDEAEEGQIDLPGLSIDDLVVVPARAEVALAGRTWEEDLRDPADGSLVGRLVRNQAPLSASVSVSAEWAAGPYPLAKLTLEVSNDTSWSPPPAPLHPARGAAGPGAPGGSGGEARAEAVRHSLVAVHSLLAVEDGRFISLVDPPEFARHMVASCASSGTYPVIAGPPGSADVILSSPIILSEHPEVAPESQGDLFDATEIDEILSLRVLTLTEDEKREARGTDARAAQIIDRCDSLPPEIWDRLHGAVRMLRPADPAEAAYADFPTITDDPSAGLTRGLPEDLAGGLPGARSRPRLPSDEFPGLVAPADIPLSIPKLPWWEPGVDAGFNPSLDTVVVAGIEVGKGTSVVLRPNRRADAHDLFVAGRRATVAGVYHDVDGDVHLAVVLADDPGADLHEWHGRYLYFRADEVVPEPLTEAGPPTEAGPGAEPEPEPGEHEPPARGGA